MHIDLPYQNERRWLMVLIQLQRMRIAILDSPHFLVSPGPAESEAFTARLPQSAGPSFLTDHDDSQEASEEPYCCVEG